MPRAELLTVQLGSFSNFVGAHFWNLQQEQCNVDIAKIGKEFHKEIDDVTEPSTYPSGIDPWILFSEHSSGLGVYSNTTYRPRLVIADVQGSLGSSSSNFSKNATTTNIKEYTSTEYENLNSSNVEQRCFQQEQGFTKHPYQAYLENSLPITRQKHLVQHDNDNVNTALPLQSVCHSTFKFSETVRCFTDYTMLDWIPAKHVELIPNDCGTYDSSDSLLHYSTGRDLMQDKSPESFFEALSDRYRMQLEESDNLGAIHLLVDWKTGFGAVAETSLDWFLENASKTPILILGNEPVWNVDTSPPFASTRFKTLQTRTQQHRLNEARLLGGGMFVKYCLDELNNRRGYSLLLSDFSRGLNSANAQSLAANVPYIDINNWYTSSSLTGLALDTMSLPYRLTGCSLSSARDLFESVLHSTNTGPLIDTFFACAASLDKFFKNKETRKLNHFLRCMWDMSQSPGTCREGIIPENKELPSIADYAQYIMTRGLSPSEEVLLVKDLVSPYRRVCLTEPSPISIPFPQIFQKLSPCTKLDEDVTQVASVLALSPLRNARKHPVLNSVRDAVEAGLQAGTQSAVASQLGYERESLIDLRDAVYFIEGEADEDSYVFNSKEYEDTID